MKTSRGFIPVFYGITEEQIEEVIEKYLENNPNDERTPEELRPFAINTILQNNET